MQNIMWISTWQLTALDMTMRIIKGSSSSNLSPFKTPLQMVCSSLAHLNLLTWTYQRPEEVSSHKECVCAQKIKVQPSARRPQIKVSSSCLFTQKQATLNTRTSGAHSDDASHCDIFQPLTECHSWKSNSTE